MHDLAFNIKLNHSKILFFYGKLNHFCDLNNFNFCIGYQSKIAAE